MDATARASGSAEEDEDNNGESERKSQKQIIVDDQNTATESDSGDESFEGVRVRAEDGAVVLRKRLNLHRSFEGSEIVHDQDGELGTTLDFHILSEEAADEAEFLFQEIWVREGYTRISGVGSTDVGQKPVADSLRHSEEAGFPVGEVGLLPAMPERSGGPPHEKSTVDICLQVFASDTRDGNCAGHIPGLAMRQPPEAASSSTRHASTASEKYASAAARHLCFDENSIVVDVGANIGMFSLYCLMKKHVKKVIAFEPLPENFAVLSCNRKEWLRKQIFPRSKSLASSDDACEPSYSRRNSTRLFGPQVGSSTLCAVANLSQSDQAFEIHQLAVADFDGAASFSFYPAESGESTRFSKERDEQRHALREAMRDKLLVDGLQQMPSGECDSEEENLAIAHAGIPVTTLRRFLLEQGSRDSGGDRGVENICRSRGKRRKLASSVADVRRDETGGRSFRGVETVETTAIPFAMDDQKTMVIDLVKIDVEGDELNVLRGIFSPAANNIQGGQDNEVAIPDTAEPMNASQHPSKYKNDALIILQFAIEVHDVDGRLEQVVRLLEEHGYEVTTKASTTDSVVDDYYMFIPASLRLFMVWAWLITN